MGGGTPVVQQLGRTHRASQTTAPRFIMLASDAPGELRKATTIAARLSQLGALRGDQRTGVVGVNLSVAMPMTSQRRWAA